MNPTEPAPAETPAAGFATFFGFHPPATLRFDDSGAAGLKVRYARMKLPVTPSQSTPVVDADTPRAVATA